MATRLDELARQLSEEGGEPITVEELREHLGPGDEVAVWEVEPLNAVTGLGHQLVVPSDDVDGWEAAAAASPAWSKSPNEPTRYSVSTWPEERTDACSLVIHETCCELRPEVGRGTLRVLECELVQAMTWACEHYVESKGSFIDFARAVARTAWRRLRTRIGQRNLWLERVDQDMRDLAVRSDDALARYLVHVRSTVLAWMAWRSRKPRSVIEQTQKHDDQANAVVVRILELLREPDQEQAFIEYERSGLPAFLQVRDRVLGDLRRRERLWSVTTPTDALHGEIPRPDHALIRKELQERPRGNAYDVLHAQLTPALKIYLDALVIELQLDDRVWGIQDRVAKRLSRSKSRVSEAFQKIRELSREHGLEDLLSDNVE